MTDASTIIQMIEFRRHMQPSPPDVAAKEQDPSRTPAFRLWNSPHYLILLVERELQALIAAGATPTVAVEILVDVLAVSGEVDDEASLTIHMLKQYFPQFDEHLSIVDDLKKIARKSVEPPKFSYPPVAWLRNRYTIDELDAQLQGQLSSHLIIPKSEFEAQLQHFKIMSRLGGDVFSFSSPPDTWKYMMGRGGYALVREERSLAFVETLMN